MQSRQSFEHASAARSGRGALKNLIELALILFSFSCASQPKSELAPSPPLDRGEGEKQARQLVARLLEQKPGQPATNLVVLKVREANGNQHEVSARFEVVPQGNNWANIYEAASGPHIQPTTLTIIHRGAQPNEYL